MTIEVLDSEIINQIAAGEVIENPSAVIKELVENSIDSGASEIEIELEDCGLKKIQINDNGCGISKEDLLKAPLRHATSKIKNFNDLYNINTMGFRGEALASIFSISKAKIISKLDSEVNYYEISSENISLTKESSTKNSTTIIIKDIFYNTPARKKYLKSQTMELKAILDIVKRFEIYYNNIKITLKNDGKILVNKPVFENKLDNLYYVLGKDLKGNLIEINTKNKGIKISGYISNPSNLTYSFKKNQNLFVNSRYVKSKIINDGIYDGYTTNLMTGRHPFYVLFIDIDPEIIDVNVHPTKIEIRFENELEIYEEIRKTIEKSFEETETFKPFETDMKLEKSISEIKNEVLPKVREYPKTNEYFTKETQSNFEVKDSKITYEKNAEKISISENEFTTKENGPLFETLSDYKILGQLNKTYIVVETKNELLLVDQHVAEEKYYFEMFKEENKNKKVKSQKLLKGEVIHLTQSEFLMYEENKNVLDSIGFETEKFGENEIVVRSVPINVRSEIVNYINLRDMLYDILINKKIKCVEEEKYSKIASMACRISVMAGDELTKPQMIRMVDNLKYLKQPFNCPHGRPTFLNYPYKELEKKFKRIV